MKNHLTLEFSKGEAYFITQALQAYIDNWTFPTGFMEEWGNVDAHIEVAEQIIEKFKEVQLQ